MNKKKIIKWQASRHFLAWGQTEKVLELVKLYALCWKHVLWCVGVVVCEHDASFISKECGCDAYQWRTWAQQSFNMVKYCSEMKTNQNANKRIWVLQVYVYIDFCISSWFILYTHLQTQRGFLNWGWYCDGTCRTRWQLYTGHPWRAGWRWGWGRY